MEKAKIDIQSFSSQDRITRFVETVNPITMTFVTIIVFCTSANPWISFPFCILPPFVGTLGSRVALKYKWSRFSLFMTFFAAACIFCICYFAGKDSPTFLAGYTNTVFAIFNIKNKKFKLFAIVLCFVAITAGCLLAGMDKFFLLYGLLSLLAYVFVLWRVLNFLLVLGGEITSAKEQIEEKNEELNQQNEEIAAQRDEIERQKELVEEQKKEMVDSITYAKRIQDAILPPIDLIKEKLPNTFVLYKPKDIVAGDFYWMEEINDTIFIAAADCTGHGVPGAIVSVICSNALNRAVKEFDLTDTGKILDKVTDFVLETFEKSSTDVKDGMDISLLAINKNTNKITWSGANNPLWYFYEGELKEIKADKQPIGKSDHRKLFTTHTIEYKPKTTFYLFTDGYADQFGGPRGKKFMYKQFQQTLSATLNKDPLAQQTALNAAFENWKGDLEQVDDVCIIGITL